MWPPWPGHGQPKTLKSATIRTLFIFYSMDEFNGHDDAQRRTRHMERRRSFSMVASVSRARYNAHPFVIRAGYKLMLHQPWNSASVQWGQARATIRHSPRNAHGACVRWCVWRVCLLRFRCCSVRRRLWMWKEPPAEYKYRVVSSYDTPGNGK